MPLYFPGSDNIEHRPAPRDHRVRHEGAMAPPGNGLRAHDRNGLSLSYLYEFFQSLSKLRCLHIIRIAPESRVPPPYIERSRSALAAAPEFRHVSVVDAGVL